MANKKNLIPGRGLDAILGNIDVEAINGPASDVTAAISMVPINDIETNPFQPRKEFDDNSLEELAQSIREQGIITPITVRRMPDGKYQLIAGERRFRASQLAGLTELPAYIRVATDGQMMEMALVENIQRENLNAIEIALSYNALIEECQLTHEQLSQRVGKDRSTITNYLRLLNLPAETQLACAHQCRRPRDPSRHSSRHRQPAPLRPSDRTARQGQQTTRQTFRHFQARTARHPQRSPVTTAAVTPIRCRNQTFAPWQRHTHHPFQQRRRLRPNLETT